MNVCGMYGVLVEKGEFYPRLIVPDWGGDAPFKKLKLDTSKWEGKAIRNLLSSCPKGYERTGNTEGWTWLR